MKRACASGAAIALILAGAAAPAAAMVPPIFQRLGELRSILDLRGLPTTFDAPIERIELIAPRLYRVTAGRCHVDVQLVEVRGGPGEGLTPPRLEPRVGRRVCGR